MENRLKNQQVKEMESSKNESVKVTEVKNSQDSNNKLSSKEENKASTTDTPSQIGVNSGCSCPGVKIDNHTTVVTIDEDTKKKITTVYGSFRETDGKLFTIKQVVEKIEKIDKTIANQSKDDSGNNTKILDKLSVLSDRQKDNAVKSFNQIEELKDQNEQVIAAIKNILKSQQETIDKQHRLIEECKNDMLLKAQKTWILNTIETGDFVRDIIDLCQKGESSCKIEEQLKILERFIDDKLSIGHVSRTSCSDYVYETDGAYQETMPYSVETDNENLKDAYKIVKPGYKWCFNQLGNHADDCVVVRNERIAKYEYKGTSKTSASISNLTNEEQASLDADISNNVEPNQEQ